MSYYSIQIDKHYYFFFISCPVLSRDRAIGKHGLLQFSHFFVREHQFEGEDHKYVLLIFGYILSHEDWINAKSIFLPDSYEIIYWLCLENCEIDVDSVPRWYSYKPEAVLKVWILIRVSWRVYGAIHCSYVSSTQSYKKDTFLKIDSKCFLHSA